MPFFGFISINSSCSKRLSASRTGVRLRPNSVVRSSSFKKVPGAYSQGYDLLADRIVSLCF